MMAQVTYANLFSEPRNNVVSLISDRSNVADPLTGSSNGSRKFIYSRFPNIKTTNFKGYPFIVIRSTDLDTEIPESSADGGSKMVNFDIEIEVYTSDTGYGDANGNGLSQMESISDDIVETLMDITNRKTLRGFGLSLAMINPTAISEEVLKQQVLYKRIIPLSFRNKLRVSA